MKKGGYTRNRLRKIALCAALGSAAGIGGTDAAVTCSRAGNEVTLGNDHLSIAFNVSQGDAIASIVARQLTAPTPNEGKIAYGPLLQTRFRVNGQEVSAKPEIGKLIDGRENVGGVDFTTRQGDLVIERHVRMRAGEAAFDDLLTCRNSGREPLQLAISSASDVTGPAYDPNNWTFPQMRFFLPREKGYGRVDVNYSLDAYAGKLLGRGKGPVVNESRHARGPVRFAFTSIRALGLHIALECDLPIAFTETHDLHKQPDNPAVRTRSAKLGWAWQCGPAALRPGAALAVRRRVLLLNGQPDLDICAGPGVLAWFDVPPYRDAGERIEISGFLSADSDRELEISAYRKALGADRWEPYGTAQARCQAGRVREVPLDVEQAPQCPGLDLAFVVTQSGTELCRVEKRICLTPDTAEGAELAKEYRRRFPDGETFEGTLRELGRLRAAQSAEKWGNGKSPEEIGRGFQEKYDLSRPAVKERVAHLLAVYRKWFPNYLQTLAGDAEAKGISLELRLYSKHPLPEDIRKAHREAEEPLAREGCLDMVFRGRHQNFLAWNKERGSVAAGIKIEYSRYRIKDGISWHGIADYGANEHGFCTAGAALNAGSKVEERAEAELKAYRAQGRLTAPGGHALLLMECRSVDDAIRLLENPDAPFVGYGNVMMADRHGRAAVWQGERLLKILRRPEDPNWKLHTCTNYPHEWERATWGSAGRTTWNGLFREANLARLAQDVHGFTLDQVTRVLRSHAEPGPICQHHHTSVGGAMTVMSYLVDTANGDLYVTYAQPCRHKYHTYSINAE
ncbi:MAG: hypothetical protein JXR37_24175 [Kiritimatiellae bacterium]|nr:hypothetical protein [Kiritimatiellia bacterium]